MEVMFHTLCTQLEENIHAGTRSTPESPFALYVRLARRTRGFTIAALAERTALTEADVISIENGLLAEQDLSSNTLARLAQGLGASYENFMELNGHLIEAFMQESATSSDWVIEAALEDNG